MRDLSAFQLTFALLHARNQPVGLNCTSQSDRIACKSDLFGLGAAYREEREAAGSDLAANSLSNGSSL